MYFRLVAVNKKIKLFIGKIKDWVEFSPYEIGMPKYGAFMKTEHFGKKFYIGKIIRTYPEMPLHFLQVGTVSNISTVMTDLKSSRAFGEVVFAFC